MESDSSPDLQNIRRTSTFKKASFSRLLNPPIKINKFIRPKVKPILPPEYSVSSQSTLTDYTPKTK